jgi:hypothetical protein
VRTPLAASGAGNERHRAVELSQPG